MVKQFLNYHVMDVFPISYSGLEDKWMLPVGLRVLFSLDSNPFEDFAFGRRQIEKLLKVASSVRSIIGFW